MYKPKTTTCGKRISEALNIRGMKQADLCKHAKVPKSSLSLYLSEAYEPKQDRVYNMARVLNVSEAWLMGYDVPMDRIDPQKQNPPTGLGLSDEEKLLIESFRKLPEESQKMYIEVLRATLKNLTKD